MFLALITALYFNLAHHFTLLIIITTPLTLYFNTLPRRYEEYTRRLMISSLLLTTRGLKNREIKLLSHILRLTQAIVAAFAILTLVYTLLVGFNMVLVVFTASALCFLLLLLTLPKLLIYSWASQRKTSSEVELPYLAILLRILSVLKMPIYNILFLIENSTAFPASAKEIKFARKIATMTGVSLLRALDIVYSHHTSEKIANLLRRVIIAATTHGDFRSVAERVFDDLYSWFESRVSELVGNFTIIVGTSLFVYLFTPVIIVVIAPVMADNLLLVLGISLTIQVFVFFTLYALILSLYPSSLVIKPSRKLKLASIAVLSIVACVMLYNVFSLVAGRDPLEEYITATLVGLASIPVLILSEARLRQAYFYNTFIRVSSDALSIAAASGENPIAVLERSASIYGKRVVRFTKTITTGYISEKLKRGVVSRAPSIFHASFLETLLDVFRLGATSEMLKVFTASYERLNTQALRIRGFAKTVEAVIAGLVSITGGFLAYIDKVFNMVLSLIQSATGGTGASIPLVIPFTYDPKIYSLLSNVSLLSLLLISILIGCIRGGSYTYSFRSFLLMLILYIVFKSIIHILIP